MMKRRRASRVAKRTPAAPERAAGVAGALAIAGVAVAVLALWPSRRATRAGPTDRCEALETYLREHLTGSDAAIRVVKRLRRTHEGTCEGRLFAWLHDNFSEERELVRELLESLGGSPWSIKRVASEAAGVALKAVAGGHPGDLSLFRTLEALAIGVQGKRCLWRAMQTLASPLRIPRRYNFPALESRALDQWEAIERSRRDLASQTFAI